MGDEWPARHGPREPNGPANPAETAYPARLVDFDTCERFERFVKNERFGRFHPDSREDGLEWNG